MDNSPKICIIGAGLSGLCMAVKLKTELDIHSFTVFEACEEVGGTWFVNTYPGCACDVPSHLYSFSFAPKYDWSHVYSPQPEILEYAKKVTKDYGIYPHIQFNTRVESLTWNERDSKWLASITDTMRNKTESDEFDIVVNSTGKIRIPHYPKEYLGFAGPIMHSAEWDHNIPLEGKRVGIVGTGASAVQIIIALSESVKSLKVFQRKAPYIFPRPQLEYPDWAKWAFSSIPGLYKISRNTIFLLHELLYGATRYNSITHRVLTKFTTWFRTKQIDDPDLKEKTTPSYSFACKRVILSESYYRTLAQSNVELITEKIEKVSGTTVTTAKNSFDLDVLILATGYQPHDFFSPMKVYGKDGEDILEKWKRDTPKGYLGVVSRDTPNFFTLLGPYSVIGHNSNIFNIECQVHWTILAIKEFKSRGAASMIVRREPEEMFMQYVEKEMTNSTWKLGQCDPWYLDKQGRNTTLWPQTQIKHWDWCKHFDPEMFEFYYKN